MLALFVPYPSDMRNPGATRKSARSNHARSDDAVLPSLPEALDNNSRLTGNSTYEPTVGAI